MILRQQILFICDYKESRLSSDNQKTEEKTPKKPSCIQELTPSENAENAEVYLEKLDEALDQSNHRVLNIALSGPFGSGKSSILETYRKQRSGSYAVAYPGMIGCLKNALLRSYRKIFDQPENQHKILKISLAEFGEDSKNPKQSGENDKDQTRVLEKSILQQMIYSTDSSTLPFSRFKRLVDIKRSTTLFYALGSLIWAGATLLLLNPQSYALNVPFDKAILVLFSIFATGVVTALYKLFRQLGTIRLSKIVLKNAEIDLSGNGGLSILNDHIDEIIYFFERTDIDVVLFEDLDRFNNIDIFVKLREINTLINSYVKIKRKVSFVYAIRDDEFTGEERTKFFDLIIPVIPAINADTSRDKLRQRLKKMNALAQSELDIHLVSTQFVDDVSLYITDYRTLHNICNEFCIYKEQIGKNVKLEKLLALITFKNFFPEDFANLHRRKGLLFYILHDMQDKIKDDLTEELKNEADAIKMAIEEAGKEHLKNNEELRAVFIYQFINDTPATALLKIANRNNTYTFVQAIQNQDIFNSLVNSGQIQLLNSGNRSLQAKIFDPNSSSEISEHYDTRLKYIEENVASTKKCLQDELEKVTIKLRNIEGLPIASLLDQEALLGFKRRINTFFGEGQPNEGKNISDDEIEILFLLLSKGSIGEDYGLFISYFYGGSMTQSDHNFIKQVKLKQVNNYSMQPDNPIEILKRLHPVDFNQSTANIYLIQALMTQFASNVDDSAAKAHRFLEWLAAKGDEQLEFLGAYCASGRDGASLLVEKLLEKDKSLIKRILKSLQSNEEHRNSTILKLFQAAQMKNIHAASRKSGLEKYLSGLNGFLSFAAAIDSGSDPDNVSLATDLVKTFDLHFEQLDAPATSRERTILQLIREERKFAINPNILTLFIKEAGIDEPLSYNAIKQSGLEDLIGFVDENIDEFVQAVMLKDNALRNEPVTTLCELLNNDSIALEHRHKLLNGYGYDIEFANLPQPLWKDALNLQFVQFDWNDLLTYFNEICEDKVIDEALAKAINSRMQSSIPTDNAYDELFYAVATSPHIEEAKLPILTKGSEEQFQLDEQHRVDDKRLRLLTQLNLLIRNQENFQIIREQKKLREEKVHLQLVDIKPETSSDEIDAYQFELNDIIGLLKCLDMESRNILLEYVDKNILTIQGATKQLRELAQEVYSYASSFGETTFELLKFTLENTEDVSSQLVLITKRLPSLSYEQITILVEVLPKPYNELSSLGTYSTFRTSEELLLLVDALKNDKYISSVTQYDEEHIRVNYRKDR